MKKNFKFGISDNGNRETKFISLTLNHYMYVENLIHLIEFRKTENNIFD